MTYIVSMMTISLPIHYISIANMIASIGLIGYLAYNHPSSNDTIPQNASTSAKAPKVKKSIPQGMPSFTRVFHDLEEPLQEIAMQKGINPSSLLPSNEELQSAIESNDIHSDESKKVLNIYKRSYEIHEIPYPALTQKDKEQEERRAKQAGEQIIKAYFQGQIMRITRAAKTQNKKISTELPSSEEIQEAASSGDISSPSAQNALGKLEKAFKELDIPFHPPTEQ